MTPTNTFNPGFPVKHQTFGRGVVEFSKEKTTLVRFSHGIEECLTSDLIPLVSAVDAYMKGQSSQISNVVLRLLGNTICSVNDAWGVFSPSRIDLYPHQLWVCRKVTEQWPVRWVVADDVGLGKTIEAGLILWRLFHLGLIKRMLILCPASLVEQWQERLFGMFDIRMTKYDTSQDSGRLDFWAMNPNVVASFHTLRDDRDGRHDRMIEAETWDLIIVDEAHHLNFDEAAGMTKAHRLIRKLQEAEKLQSLIFFTGTPHRGKHFGFFALMSLVRPDLFDPRKPVEPQLGLLNQALIRNNKYHVTNLRGERLFREPQVNSVAYHYNPEEDSFYQMMTDFIASGRTYARGLNGQESRTIMLVLIALQKLASSSVAAVRSALQKRLVKMREITSKMQNNRQAVPNPVVAMEKYADDADSLNPIVEDEIATIMLKLMEDECARLEELISAADNVAYETKIQTIIKSVRNLPDGESVLFFTEYKVTQALLMSALWREFGDGCATFINGDSALPNVVSSNGSRRDLRETRQGAKDRFNSGAIRFLISTEAAGEGIDLQEHCSRLIHVDLPWNPMRLHQRVGRLNRIGQKEIVKVMLFQNPDTVESRIWTLLNEKLERIRCSINAVTEEPEDLHQLVLGIARPGMLDEVFSHAETVPRARLDQWFDEQTGQMGGEDAVHVVQDLLGHAQHFDFAQVSERVPKLDLPDLASFFRLALRHNHRQLKETDGVMMFKTPDMWKQAIGIRPNYEDVHFERMTQTGKKGTVLGVGNRLFDTALSQACNLSDSYSFIKQEQGFEHRLLLVFRCYDRITGNPAQPKAVICGILFCEEKSKILRDWELMIILNKLANSIKPSTDAETYKVPAGERNQDLFSKAETLLRKAFPKLDIPFLQPDLELIGIIDAIGNDQVKISKELLESETKI
jgi:ERCC4-related helicase